MNFTVGKLYKFTDRTIEVNLSAAVRLKRISISPGKYVHNMHTKFLCMGTQTRTSMNEFRDCQRIQPVRYTFVILLDLNTLEFHETISYNLRFEQI